jgi:hypothetical protein
MSSSWMLRRVALVRTDISEERIASIISVTRIGKIGTALAVTGNRRATTLVTLMMEVILSPETWLFSSGFPTNNLYTFLKNGVFWVVTPCGSRKNRRFGGTWPLLHQGDKNR